MTTKLIHIEEEDLEVQVNEDMGILVHDLKRDYEIEISPEVAGKLMGFYMILNLGVQEAIKKGVIPKTLIPDWK